MKQHLSLALALTVTLALPVPGFAQMMQPSPPPSVEPSSGPSVTVPIPSSSSEPTVLKSLKGTKAVLKLADGTMQTFNVTAQTAALLKSHLNKNGVFRVVDGVLTLVPAGVPGY